MNDHRREPNRARVPHPRSGIPMALECCVVGRLPVLECLRAGKRRPRRLFVSEGAQGVEAFVAAAPGLAVEAVPRADLNRWLPEALHQGVMLEADPLPVLAVDAWLKGDLPADALVVVLDGVEDPHNFGAIVRSAAACGAAAALFGKDRSAPLSPVSVKSAAGAMEHIDLVQATNVVRGLNAMKGHGFWIAGLDEHATQSLWQADLKGRMALVIGSEGRGIRRLVRDTCDFVLRIPVCGPIKSLNASVSAGVALAECLRQRTV